MAVTFAPDLVDRKRRLPYDGEDSGSAICPERAYRRTWVRTGSPSCQTSTSR
jgi:hypothetical protein